MSNTLLKRQLGLSGAVIMGLGSIIGTGVFVSLGLAAGITGPSVVLAVAIAAGVALCNGLSAAQLAANHPVSGGTYEYGYRYLNPWLGFTAGWLFLLAKSASAATAALGFSGYLLNILGLGDRWIVPLALATVVVMTGIVLNGIQRSNQVNLAILTVTFVSLTFFVLAGLPLALSQGGMLLVPFFGGDHPGWAAVLQASALMFVAYTGYGRITTMGEEVHQPEITIPRAILLTLGITMTLYMSIALVGVAAVGVDTLQQGALIQAAPLAVAAERFGIPGSSVVLTVGAIAAMLGVLLNLILGLSRVLLAMGRRGDMPRAVARVNANRTTPPIAVIVMGTVTGVLVLLGNVKTTWSFSAFTVLSYYALTNLAALRLSRSERKYPRWTTWIGFLACLSLAFWVEWQVWLVGLGIILIGLAWKMLINDWTKPRSHRER
ncbi:MAG: APC family permease [Synechococcales bacterium]|nr:APC family permease [Synechococcales bacterium]